MLPAEKKVKRTIQNTSVCSYGGFAYGGRLIKEWGLESLGIIEYDSKEGGAHGGVFGLEIGPVVLGVESLRTWNDWKSHTGPIVIGGGEFSAASKISGKNVKAGTLVGISLSSATDFVSLRPPISLIAAGGDRSEATLEFVVIA